MQNVEEFIQQKEREWGKPAKRWNRQQIDRAIFDYYYEAKLLSEHTLNHYYTSAQEAVAEIKHREVEYRRERVKTMLSVSDYAFGQGFIDEQHIRDELSMQLEAFLFARTLDKQYVFVTPKRQSFWDYILFRKPAAQRIAVDVRDFLVSPPARPEGARVIRLVELSKEQDNEQQI